MYNKPTKPIAPELNKAPHKVSNVENSDIKKQTEILSVKNFSFCDNISLVDISEMEQYFAYLELFAYSKETFKHVGTVRLENKSDFLDRWNLLFKKFQEWVEKKGSFEPKEYSFFSVIIN